MLGVRPDLNKAMALSGVLEMATFWKEFCQKQKAANRGVGGGKLRTML